MEEERSIEGSGGPEDERGQPLGGDGGEQGRTEGGQERGATHAEPSTFDSLKTWAGGLFGQASEVIIRPGEFFDGLSREGGLGHATVFAIVMGVVAGVIGFCLRVLPSVSSVFTMPFAAFAGTVVGAVLIHVLAMLAGGKGPLEASYRLAAYLMAFLPAVVAAGLLPYLNLAMAGYALYALILGAVSVHDLEERRAWSVFGVVGVAVLGFALLGRLASDDGPGGHKLELLERQLEHLRQRRAK